MPGRVASALPRRAVEALYLSTPFMVKLMSSTLSEAQRRPAMRLIAFYSTFALLSAAQGFVVPNAAFAQSASALKLNEWQSEKANLCGWGTELTIEATNPSCQRWQITNTGSDAEEMATYRKFYPNDCYRGTNIDGSPGLDRCFFRFSGRHACNAYAHVQTEFKLLVEAKPPPAGNGMKDFSNKPFCPTGHDLESAGTTFFKCGYCANETPAELNAGAADICKPVGMIPPGGQIKKGKFIDHPPPAQCTKTGTFDIELTEMTGEAGLPFSYCHGSNVVSGPYRDIPLSYRACGGSFQYANAFKGLRFTIDQKDQIKAVNKANSAFSDKNGMKKLTSDFAGLCYPKRPGLDCTETSPGSKICKEPATLKEMGSAWDSAQIHHVLPRTDRRGCPCGDNSFSNAAVISKHLNLVIGVTPPTESIFVKCSASDPTPPTRKDHLNALAAHKIHLNSHEPRDSAGRSRFRSGRSGER